VPTELAAKMLGVSEGHLLNALEQKVTDIGWVVQGKGRRSPFISPYRLRQLVGEDAYNKVLSEYTGKEALP